MHGAPIEHSASNVHSSYVQPQPAGPKYGVQRPFTPAVQSPSLLQLPGNVEGKHLLLSGGASMKLPRVDAHGTLAGRWFFGMR